MDLDLKNKTVLVTGGTRGIGKAIVETFAAEGANVALCARDAKAVKEGVVALEKKGVKAFGRAFDVADSVALTQFVQDTAKHFGGLDAVVANASALAGGNDIASFKAAFDVDLMHTRALAEAALPHLEKSKAGTLCAISSVSGSEAYGYGSVAYGTMKAALFFYVKSLARHVAPKGIRANVVSPGTTLFAGGHWDEVRINEPERFASTLAENPLGRMATPEEIANAVVFLASTKASFISGVNLTVDGTLTMRIPN